MFFPPFYWDGPLSTDVSVCPIPTRLTLVSSYNSSVFTVGTYLFCWPLLLVSVWPYQYCTVDLAATIISTTHPHHANSQPK